MNKCLNYNIKDVEYLKTRGDILCRVIREWLLENGVDALVHDFAIEEKATLVVDYSFDKNTKEEKVKKLTEQILKRFNITYKLEKMII